MNPINWEVAPAPTASPNPGEKPITIGFADPRVPHGDFKQSLETGPASAYKDVFAKGEQVPIGAGPTPSGRVIDVAALEANLQAIAAACRTPGLVWQQQSAIQAGIDFATPARAAAAIRAANSGGSPAPAGLPRIPSAEELAAAAAAGRAWADSLGSLLNDVVP